MTGRTVSLGPRRLAAGLAALLLVGVTGACYHYSGARYGGPDAPLQARVAQSFGEHAFQSFAVSDRAHVAIFRVHDSGYARAVYPYHPGSSSVFTPGAHTVTASTPSFLRGWRPLTRFATRRGAPHTCGGGFGHFSTSYLMIVASRRPLRLERIRDEVPFRYRRVSALATPFFGVTAFGTMDRLLARLIPEGLPREDWDVDWTVAADFGSSWCRGLRPPLFRRIAAQPQPAPDDTTQADERTRRLDGDDVPFNPPGIPIDLPEVTSVDGDDRSRVRVRVPLPPVDVTPVPRVAPEGEPEELAVEELEALERERRPTERPGEGRERRPSETGAPSAPVPSEHFGRLFGGDRGEAEGWIPGWSGDAGRTTDRRVRRGAREFTKWVNDPDRHEFPEPTRPPARWRSGNDWQGGARGFDRPARPLGDLGDPRPVNPSPGSNPARDIEVRRPSTTDRGGDSGVRKSGGGSSDDRGGG